GRTLEPARRLPRRPSGRAGRGRAAPGGLRGDHLQHHDAPARGKPPGGGPGGDHRPAAGDPRPRPRRLRGAGGGTAPDREVLSGGPPGPGPSAALERAIVGREEGGTRRGAPTARRAGARLAPALGSAGRSRAAWPSARTRPPRVERPPGGAPGAGAALRRAGTPRTRRSGAPARGTRPGRASARPRPSPAGPRAPRPTADRRRSSPSPWPG